MNALLHRHPQAECRAGLFLDHVIVDSKDVTIALERIKALENELASAKSMWVFRFCKDFTGIDEWDRMIDGMFFKDVAALCHLLLIKRSVDGMNGRPWDASKHLEYDDLITSTLPRVEETKKVAP